MGILFPPESFVRPHLFNVSTIVGLLLLFQDHHLSCCTFNFYWAGLVFFLLLLLLRWLRAWSKNGYLISNAWASQGAKIKYFSTHEQLHLKHGVCSEWEQSKKNVLCGWWWDARLDLGDVEYSRRWGCYLVDWARKEGKKRTLRVGGQRHKRRFMIMMLNTLLPYFDEDDLQPIRNHVEGERRHMFMPHLSPSIFIKYQDCSYPSFDEGRMMFFSPLFQKRQSHLISIQRHLL